MKKIFVIVSAVLVFSLAACDSDLDPGQNAVMKMSNEWWAQLYIPDGSGGLIDLGYGYVQYLTSGTASGTADSLFVDDFGTLLELRAKVFCNVNNMTFTTNGTPVKERYTGGTVAITNGKILPNAGKSASGVVVDSLYFEAEFDWDPGQTYVVAGHARTGFLEDEH